MNSTVSADVVVLGAGIVGSACAYYLADAGLDVALVDRGYVAAGTTGACQSHIGGWADLLGRASGSRARATWYAAAVEEWHLAASRDLGLSLRPTGGLLVADGPEASQALLDDSAYATQRGASFQQIEPSEFGALGLAADLEAVVLDPAVEQVDPIEAAWSFTQAAIDRGCTVEFCAPSPTVHWRSDRIAAVQIAERQIATRTVVLAAGVWTRELARKLGVELPIVPCRGHLVMLDTPVTPLCHSILELAYDKALGDGVDPASAGDTRPTELGTIIQQRQSGRIVVGSSREYDGFELSPNPAVIAEIQARAHRFSPKLATARIHRVYAGLRPMTPDGLPLVGPCPPIDGLFIAAGHGAGGIAGAPITGRLIAEIVVGQTPCVPQPLVAPRRFDEH